MGDANTYTEELAQPLNVVVDYNAIEDTVHSGEDSILKSLSPKTKEKVLMFIKELRAKYPDLKFNVVEGARSAKRQLELYQKGASKLATGGMHQQRKAIDAYPIVDGKILDPNSKEGKDLYEDIGKIAESSGLSWGGRWDWKDWGHFEDKENAQPSKASSKESFKNAFRRARKAGLSSFAWRGKLYTTKLKGG